MQTEAAERLKSRLLEESPLLTAEIGSMQELQTQLESLLLAVERELGGDVLTSILLLDSAGKRLLHGAGPSLPEAYNAAIHGIKIGPSVGSCGSAAYLGHPVYVADISNNPLWEDFKDLADEHGLRACWSTPVQGAEGEVVGTFAVYHRAPRGPTAEEVEAINLISHVAALAIERYRASVGGWEPRSWSAA